MVRGKKLYLYTSLFVLGWIYLLGWCCLDFRSGLMMYGGIGIATFECIALCISVSLDIFLLVLSVGNSSSWSIVVTVPGSLE